MRGMGRRVTQGSDSADVCRSVLDGYNVCLFAYGQTGSGKTHTMQARAQTRGLSVLVRACMHAFMHARTFICHVSIMRHATFHMHEMAAQSWPELRLLQ